MVIEKNSISEKRHPNLWKSLRNIWIFVADYIRRNAENIPVHYMSTKSLITKLFGKTSNLFFFWEEKIQKQNNTWGQWRKHHIWSYHTYVCVSGGKKCQFFGKFCVRTKWMTPNIFHFAIPLGRGFLTMPNLLNFFKCLKSHNGSKISTIHITVYC